MCAPELQFNLYWIFRKGTAPPCPYLIDNPLILMKNGLT